MLGCIMGFLIHGNYKIKSLGLGAHDPGSFSGYLGFRV